MTTTASPNVFIMDENFHLPHLDRTRRIWLYLPAGYADSEERYPVLYMHDGQNLFDEHNAFGREWELDETLDEWNGKIIVVGIDNGMEHRMPEFMLHDHPEHGPGEGASYLKDIVEALKPVIDSNFRTLAGRESTGIAGSSMGGLISLYAGIYFPHIFGSVGIFSPALWLDAPGVFSEAKNAVERFTQPQRWYFYGGAMESETMVAEVATMVKILRESPLVNVTYQIDSSGIHDEELWKNYFRYFYAWYTGIVPDHKIEKESDIKID